MAPTLKEISALSRAGLLELSNALQLTLIRIGTSNDESDYFEQLDGDLGREVRDLVYHLLNEIPDPRCEDLGR